MATSQTLHSYSEKKWSCHCHVILISKHHQPILECVGNIIVHYLISARYWRYTHMATSNGHTHVTVALIKFVALTFSILHSDVRRNQTDSHVHTRVQPDANVSAFAFDCVWESLVVFSLHSVEIVCGFVFLLLCWRFFVVVFFFSRARVRYSVQHVSMNVLF